MEESPMPVQRNRQSFSFEEKVALFFLVLAGLMGVFYGIRFINGHLTEPYRFVYEGETILSSFEEEEREEEALKERDTDGDTISDYDELYLYNTSPYLSDSDSDGFSDSTELESGNDPNCPVGEDCSQPDVLTDSTDDLIGGLGVDGDYSDAALQQLLDQFGDDGTKSQDEIYDDLASLTPNQIRDLLIQSGVDEALLSQYSDAELQQLYLDVVSDAQSSDE